MILNTSENNKTALVDKVRQINYRPGEYSLSDKYHKSEIDLNKKIIINAICMIWVGIAMLVGGTILAVKCGGTAWLAVIPGAFVDLFSGTMLHLINKSSESKQQYFNELSREEREQRLIEEIRDIQDEELKKELYAKIIEEIYNDQRGSR